VLTAVMLDE
jgi:hypothetical protein